MCVRTHAHTRRRTHTRSYTPHTHSRTTQTLRSTRGACSPIHAATANKAQLREGHSQAPPCTASDTLSAKQHEPPILPRRSMGRYAHNHTGGTARQDGVTQGLDQYSKADCVTHDLRVVLSCTSQLNSAHVHTASAFPTHAIFRGKTHPSKDSLSSTQEGHQPYTQSLATACGSHSAFPCTAQQLNGSQYKDTNTHSTFSISSQHTGRAGRAPTHQSLATA